MSSLTEHQVIIILPHSNGKETSLLPSLQVDRQSLPIRDIALQPMHGSQDLYEGHEAHPTMPEGRYNSVIAGLCSSLSQLLHSSEERLEESGTVVTETGFCAVLGKVPAGTHSRIYSPWPGVQHTEYDFVISPRQGLDKKGSGSQSGLSPT